MIFKYDGTADSLRKLIRLLNDIREKDGHITTCSVVRMQGFHNGHKKLLDFSEEIGDKNILVLGSCQESGTIANPYSPSDRIEAIRLVKGYNKRFSGKLSIVKMEDINAITPDEWSDAVISKIENWNGDLTIPNVYIGGSELDIIDNGFPKEGMLAISLERLNSGLMSATDVRKSIINGNDEWKHFVPFVLHDFLVDKFPVELTVAYQKENLLMKGNKND